MKGKEISRVPWGQMGVVFTLLVAIGLIIYSNTWHAPFVFDDVHAILEDESRRDLDLSWQNWTGNRSIPYLTLDLNYYWHGYNLPGYHAVNIAVHLATSGTVFFIGYLLSGLLIDGRPVKVIKWWIDYRIFVGAIAAMVFLAHPIQTQAVTYVIQRLASIATLFYAQSIMWYLFYRTGKGGWRYAWAFLSILTGVAAMHSKEISFTLPVVIALIEFTVWPVRASGAKVRTALFKFLRVMPWLLLMFIIPMYMLEVPGIIKAKFKYQDESAPEGVYVPSFSVERIGNVSIETQGLSRSLYLKTQFSVIAKYMGLIALPRGQNIDHDHAWAQSFWEFRTWSSLVVIVTLFGISVMLLLRRGKIIGLGGLMFFIMLSVESSLVPIRDVIFEHRLYLPMIGVSMIVGAASFFIYKWLTLMNGVSRKVRFGFLITLMLYIFVLGMATWKRNYIWADELRLWRDAAEKSPNKARPKNNLGKALLNRRLFDEAKEQYMKEVEIDPESVSGHNNLGSIYGLQGDYEKALEEVNKALAINNRHDSSYNNLGNIYMLQGRLEEAEVAYETSLDINPKDAGVWANLGDMRMKKEEYDEAEEAFRRAIEMHDEKAEWHSKLGAILGQRGEAEAAEKELRIAIQIDPASISSYVNLGNVLKESEKWEGALAAYATALRMRPNDKEVVTSLGEVFFGLDKVAEAKEAWEAVLKVDPEHERARKNMEMAR